jgi:NitT/TauT family transport system substrate-binding protein
MIAHTSLSLWERAGVRALALAAALALSLAACGGSAAKQSAALDSFKLSISNYAGVYSPFLIAVDKGYFAAQGLDVQIQIAAGGLAVPSLLSGEVPYTASAATAMGAIIKGAPLKVIYTNADRSVQQLWSAADIKTLQDLKGRTIGVASRGDSNEVTVRMLLAQEHIDPSTIAFTALGSPANAISALQAGAVPVAVIGATYVSQLKQSNYTGHLLYDLTKVQLLYNGLATSDKELQEHRDRAKKLLYAVLQGRDYFRAYKDESIAVLAKYAQQKPEDLVQDYETSLAAMTEDGTMPVEAQQADAAVRAGLIQVPASEIPPVDHLYDYTLIKQAYQELRASGWKPTK